MKSLYGVMSCVFGLVACVGIALAQPSHGRPSNSVAPALPATNKSQAANNESVLGQLYRSGTVDLSLNGPGVVASGVQCDEDGNIYLLSAPTPQIVMQMAPTGLNLPVTKIDVGSGNEVEYPLGPFSNYHAFYQHDFFVTPGGSVYRLVSAYRHKRPQPGNWPDNLVVKYNTDGTVDSVTRLQSPQGAHLDAYKLAVFQDGNLLVVGALIAGERHLPTAPFRGIFDSSGDYLSDVGLPGGAQPSSPAPPGASAGNSQERLSGRPVPLPWSMAIRQGLIVASPDGTVYLIEASSPAHLYVISSIGKVLRHLTVRPPASGMEPAQASVNGQGQLLVEFIAGPAGPGERASAILGLVDPATGNVLARFDAPFGAGIPACATMQNEFLFLGADKAGNLEIQKFLAH